MGLSGPGKLERVDLTEKHSPRQPPRMPPLRKGWHPGRQPSPPAPTPSRAPAPAKREDDAEKRPSDDDSMEGSPESLEKP